MLDIERRPHVDAGVEQFLDILPALGMAALRRIGVGELVHHDQSRLARQSGVDVEFLDGAAAIFDGAAGQDFLPFEQDRRLRRGRGFRPARSPHRARRPSDGARLAAWRKSSPRRARRRGRLSVCRACRSPSAPAARRDRGGDRVRAPSPCPILARHLSSSSARLSLSTLTRGSPKKPIRGFRIWARTRLRTFPTSRPRALGDVRRLKQSVFRRNVRVEPRGRSRQGVGGHKPGPAFRALGLDAGLHPVDQRLAGRPEIGAAGIVGVIGGVDGLAGVFRVRRAGRRGARMEIFRRGEILADQRRADDLAVAQDQRAAGLPWEQDGGDRRSWPADKRGR